MHSEHAVCAADHHHDDNRDNDEDLSHTESVYWQNVTFDNWKLLADRLQTRRY